MIRFRFMSTLLATAVCSAIAPGQARADDPFERADLQFRAFYAAARAATLTKLEPVIVVDKDQLVLIRDGKRTEVTVIPALYHRLKAISHVPLALYVALAPFGDQPIDVKRLDSLRSFRDKVNAIASSLADSGLSTEQVARSRPLLERCQSMLVQVLGAGGKYDPAALRALTKAAGPIVLANAGDAARAQIDAYHAQVSQWRREIPPAEWARLHVVVMGLPMPRKHNVAVQYFAKLLDLPGESRTLVYAEELSGQSQGLNLLATHQLDSELSEAFFGDRERMEIDLIGNAASVYLDGFDVSK